MRDSQQEPGAYPRHNPSGPSPDQSSQSRRRPESNGQSRPPARRSSMAGSDPSSRARPPLPPHDQPTGRPRPPSAEESREEQFERTARLQALRKDFLDHTQTKVKPQKPRNVWIAALLTGSLLFLCIGGLIAFFQLRPTLFTNGGQTLATQFMDAMQQKNYTAAYANCTSDVQEAFSDHSGPLSKNAFIQQAEAADQLGPITKYTVGNLTTIDSTHEQYVMSVTRKLQQPINVTIGFVKGDDGSWKINSIGSALFPIPPAPPDDTPTATPTSDLNLPGRMFLV